MLEQELKYETQKFKYYKQLNKGGNSYEPC